MGKLIIGLLFFMSVAPALSYAGASETEQALQVVQQQLIETNKKLDLLLVGQKRLSIEHSQIKKWVHKR